MCNTMLYFDGYFDGHGDGDVTSGQTFSLLMAIPCLQVVSLSVYGAPPRTTWGSSAWRPAACSSRATTSCAAATFSRSEPSHITSTLTSHGASSALKVCRSKGSNPVSHITSTSVSPSTFSTLRIRLFNGSNPATVTSPAHQCLPVPPLL